MRKRILTALIIAPLLAALMCGCAAFRKGPTDEEQVRQVVGEWVAAAQAQDVDKLMTFYSEDYAGSEGEDKADVRRFLQGVIDQGYFEGLEADMQYTEVSVEDGKATVAPVDLSSSAGSISVAFQLKKDPDGVWRIVNVGEY